jgi:hypothetical protein
MKTTLLLILSLITFSVFAGETNKIRDVFWKDNTGKIHHQREEIVTWTNVPPSTNIINWRITPESSWKPPQVTNCPNTNHIHNR